MILHLNISAAGAISATTILLLMGFILRHSNNKKMISEKEQKRQKKYIKFLEGERQVISLQNMVNG